MVGDTSASSMSSALADRDRPQPRAPSSRRSVLTAASLVFRPVSACASCARRGGKWVAPSESRPGHPAAARRAEAGGSPPFSLAARPAGTPALSSPGSARCRCRYCCARRSSRPGSGSSSRGTRAPPARASRAPFEAGGAPAGDRACETKQTDQRDAAGTEGSSIPLISSTAGSRARERNDQQSAKSTPAISLAGLGLRLRNQPNQPIKSHIRASSFGISFGNRSASSPQPAGPSRGRRSRTWRTRACTASRTPRSRAPRRAPAQRPESASRRTAAGARRSRATACRAAS